jgi:hypothetical protein
MEQSKRDCPKGKIPSVFFRRNGRKEWLVILTADNVCDLARQIAPSNVKIEYVPSNPVSTTVGAGFWVHNQEELTPYIQPKLNPNK